jgi:hypothetical protein
MNPIDKQFILQKIDFETGRASKYTALQGEAITKRMQRSSGFFGLFKKRAMAREDAIESLSHLVIDEDNLTFILEEDARHSRLSFLHSLYLYVSNTASSTVNLTRADHDRLLGLTY